LLGDVVSRRSNRSHGIVRGVGAQLHDMVAAASASEFVPDAVVTAHGIFTGEEVREVKVISIELQAYPSFQSIGLASFHQAAELVRSCHCLTCF
jgi:hypothetical protein